MSDEESFVILGSSPLPSLSNEADQQADVDNSDHSFCSLKVSQLKVSKDDTTKSSETSWLEEKLDVKGLSISSPVASPITTVEVSQVDGGKKLLTSSLENSLTSPEQIITNGSNSMKSMNSSAKSVEPKVVSSSRDSSLAASFLMGEIGADVLKTSVYSQFPSLCSMEACAEDVVKLQSFMTEYLELKNTLAKVNVTMKQFYQKTMQWREDLKNTEEKYKQSTQELQLQIASLKNENLELKREVGNKIEQLQICDNLRQSDYKELIQTVSEKTAQINNMRFQIEKLEQHQLQSFEYIPKNENDSKDKPDYVDRLEHERVVKEMGREKSELLAENLDLKDVQKQYIDELTCLKVNLVAAEELIKQLKADVNVLKAKDIEKSEIFSRYERERDEQREEIELLRQQVNVYSKDFEMERTARQNLAGEKDQLLQDLRTLQRKNHTLIEEAQKQWEMMEKRGLLKPNPSPMNSNIERRSPAALDSLPSSSSSSLATSSQRNGSPLKTQTTPANTEKTETSVMRECPICSKGFSCLNALQTHASNCISKI